MKKLSSIMLVIYVVVLTLAVPYFNYQYAQENGFVRWVFFGEFIATVKGFAWPYFFAVSFFPNERGVEAPAYAQQKPYEVHCTEPMPMFTLGYKSNPTKTRVAELCSCIWQNLGKWERDTSEKIQQGKDSEISTLNMGAFPSRFGSAIKKCGGMDI